MKVPFVIISLFIVFFVFNLNAIQLDLEPGEMKCVGQELDQEDSAVFVFGGNTITKKKVVTSQKLTVVVNDGDEKEILNERILIGNRPKEFHIDIETRGVHEMCFELEGGNTPIRAFFHVDFKSKSAEAIEIAKKNALGKHDIPQLELQLISAESLLTEISKEIDFARRQENILKEAGDAMTSRIQRFGTLSICILLLTSLWQLIYLRRFFSSKKLL